MHLFTGIAQFGEQMRCQRLVEKSLFLIKQRFLKIIETQDFLELSPPWLLKILKMDDLFLGLFLNTLLYICTYFFRKFMYCFFM